MADQDFQINIRTIADTTGIKLTQQQLTALQTAARQGNQEAIAALRQLTAAQKEASASLGLGFSGAAVGVGTIVTLLTGAISKWKAFNAELDVTVERMIKAQEKMRELGNAIVETQDKMISQRRTATEPLEQSYVRLQQELVRLTTEQGSLDLPRQGEEWKKYQSEITAVTAEIEKLRAELERTKPGGTAAPETPFPKARKGESQALVDEIERNRRAAEEQAKEDVWEFDPETGGYKLSGRKQFPVFQPPPQPPQQQQSDWTTGAGRIGGPNWKQLIKEAFEESMSRYWGP